MRNLASLGIMISGVAHELNNPLTGISLTVQNLVNNLSHFAPELILNRLDLIQKTLLEQLSLYLTLSVLQSPSVLNIR